jgi:hypothetical protein
MFPELNQNINFQIALKLAVVVLNYLSIEKLL